MEVVPVDLDVHQGVVEFALGRVERRNPGLAASKPVFGVSVEVLLGLQLVELERVGQLVGLQSAAIDSHLFGGVVVGVDEGVEELLDLGEADAAVLGEAGLPRLSPGRRRWRRPGRW